MVSLAGLTYVKKISATRNNARSVKKLTLQDLRAGKFPNPLTIADPTDEGQVGDQVAKLVTHPERYSGYMKDGELVAYMKQMRWSVRDAAPFATGFIAILFKLLLILRLNLPTGQWGVMGLVASDELEQDIRMEVLIDLFERSLVNPKNGEPRRTINIVLHDHDPFLGLASSVHCHPRGKKGFASGAPGLLQTRFQRRLSK